MKRIWEGIAAFLGVTFAMTVSIGWMLGGPAGAIWAAINDDILNAVLSIVIPFYGAVYVIIQLFE